MSFGEQAFCLFHFRAFMAFAIANESALTNNKEACVVPHGVMALATMIHNGLHSILTEKRSHSACKNKAFSVKWVVGVESGNSSADVGGA